MSDWFPTIADIDVGPAEAEQVGTAVLEWLIASGVVVAEVTDCALGDGHAPGPNFGNAVSEADPRLLGLQTKGMKLGGVSCERKSCRFAELKSRAGRTAFCILGTD